MSRPISNRKPRGIAGNEEKIQTKYAQLCVHTLITAVTLTLTRLRTLHLALTLIATLPLTPAPPDCPVRGAGHGNAVVPSGGGQQARDAGGVALPHEYRPRRRPRQEVDALDRCSKAESASRGGMASTSGSMQRLGVHQDAGNEASNRPGKARRAFWSYQFDRGMRALRKSR